MCLLLTAEALDFSPQLLNLVLQVPQTLLWVGSTARSHTTSGRRRRRAIAVVGVLGRVVGAQVGYALDLEVRVPGRAGFRPSGRPYPVALLEDGREPTLHVGRPVEPGAVVQHCPIRLTQRGGREPL